MVRARDLRPGGRGRAPGVAGGHAVRSGFPCLPGRPRAGGAGAGWCGIATGPPSVVPEPYGYCLAGGALSRRWSRGVKLA